MYKQFLEAVLPSQGNYCIFTLTDGKPKTRFAENGSTEDASKFIEAFKQQPPTNIYFALSSFDGFSRKADDSIYIKSFFLDLDVGKEKNSYATKEDAYAGIDAFITALNLPAPVVVDSGNGLHVYWILKEAIETSVWKPYAEKFKDLCHQHGLVIDPAVPADAARVLRVPFTKNYGKDGAVKDVTLVNDEIYTYDFNEIVSCFGEVATSENKENTFDPKNISKGLTDDERKLLGYDKYEYKFQDIAVKSLEGTGCAQIKFIIEEASSCPEPLWRAGLSVAVRCADGPDAIHKLSEDYPNYDPADTERKAEETLSAKWSYRCAKFEDLNPEGCKGCPHKGTIKSPIALGKRLRVAQPRTDDPADTAEPEEVQVEDSAYPVEYIQFPESLFPFVRAVGGGIYHQPPPKTQKDGTQVAQPPSLLYPYDIVPLKRLHSPYDGECLFLRLFLPKDGIRDLVMPSKFIGASDKFKEFLFSNSIVLNDTKVALFKEYLMKWNNYLINLKKAEDMRMQMGWTSNPDYGSFVVGKREITPKGEFDCPVGPTTRNIAKHLVEEGDYNEWRKAAKELNRPGLEYHALGLLAGFGSPLVKLGNVGGLVISFCGEKGAGKTGALQAGLSVFGNPKKLKIETAEGATSGGLYQRASGLGNILMGVDETSNMDGKVLSNAVFRLPMNENGKIRLQTSYNNERITSEGSQLLVIFTTNQSNIQKLYETGKHDPEGELRRMVEFDIYKHSGKFSDSDGKLLFNPFTEHYGFAGPDFIRAVYNLGLPYVKQRLSYWHSRLQKDFVNDTAYTYWSAGLATCFAGGEIAVMSNIMDIDVERIYGFILEDLHAKHKMLTANKITYEDIVSEYVLTNITSLLAINGDKVSVEPRTGVVAARCEIDTSRVFLMSDPFKEYLAKKKINVTQFEKVLHEKGILVNKSVRKRMASGWKEATGAFNVRAYEFKMDIADIIKDAEEPDNIV
jgi:hypothetical protein